MTEVGVRWTIGDVSARGFEALGLSLWGARRVLGPDVALTVCVNSVPVEAARRRAGSAPAGVQWREVTRADLPAFLLERLDPALAEGVAWKFAPLRVHAGRELALDNDCILWDLPAALRAWLDDPRPDACLIAEDVRPCFGRFAALCGSAPRNSGMRGIGAGFDLERALRETLAEVPGTLSSELDEQGLQVAVCARRSAHVVSVEDVTICSPFPPHQQHLGRAGAHFVGLNARTLPWSYEGTPAHVLTAAHWDGLRDEVRARVGGGRDLQRSA